MRVQFITLVAVMALLGACETPSEEAGGAGSAGGGAAGGSEVTPGAAGGGEIREEALTPVVAEQKLVEIGDRVFFGFDRYDLSPEAHTTLDQQAVFLRKYPSLTVIIEGHADERGTREYNLALGDRRATSVKDYLVALGIDPGRIRTVSYGEERPAVVGSNESAWAQNRRAVTVVIGSAAGS